MKTSKSFRVSINIVGIFIIAIFASFIPDQFHLFFEDTFCLGNIGDANCIEGWRNSHGKDWHWGYRHYLWSFMGFALFIVQVVRLAAIIDEK